MNGTLSLREQTEALYAEQQRNLPPELMARLDGAVAELAKSGIESRCLKKGDKIPYFELPDSSGKLYDVQKLLARGPLILYRGGWCIFCSLELRALQAVLPQIHAKGAELLAITPQRAQRTQQTVDEHALGYPILTDFGNRVAESFGLAYELSPLIRPIMEQGGIHLHAENEVPGHRLPVTATYIVDTSGTIVAAFTDPNHFKRMEPADIVAALP
jgi:peroxiredoxin